MFFMCLPLYHLPSTPFNLPDNLRDISGISMQAELLVGRGGGGREGATDNVNSCVEI